jgi:hypothetical protein
MHYPSELPEQLLLYVCSERILLLADIDHLCYQNGHGCVVGNWVTHLEVALEAKVGWEKKSLEGSRSIIGYTLLLTPSKALDNGCRYMYIESDESGFYMFSTRTHLETLKSSVNGFSVFLLIATFVFADFDP